MEYVLKTALLGGYEPAKFMFDDDGKFYSDVQPMLCFFDSNLFRALGEACNWNTCEDCNVILVDNENDRKHLIWKCPKCLACYRYKDPAENWRKVAMEFYKINLRDGFEFGIQYLWTVIKL